ncbi:MAG TPA: vgr related protein, partial [Sphingomicrobium sp.]|nr:vgr related protein [Sphingomicrobium sp.]
FHPHAGGWSEDFSKDALSRQGFFIHEMTHVWQAQRCGPLYLPLMRHPFCRYSYALKPGKPFHRYGLEQQAEIVRHYFLALRGAAMPIVPPRSLMCFE